jgi:hypothetical protein
MPASRRFVPLLYALCAPWDATVLALVALLAPLLRLELSRRRGVVWARLPESAPLARVWRYSTTLGHVVLLQARAEGSDVEDHELVHVVQFEAAVVSVWLAALSALLVAELGTWPFAWGVVLLLGPWWGYFGASLAAGLRGGAPYLDNAFERHARAEVALQASSEKGVKSVSRS